MLTIPEINRINALLPGEHTTLDGKQLECHESKPYLSADHCCDCALHRIRCDGVSCMRGMLVRKSSPDGTPTEIPRENDVYFTMYM